MSEQPTRRHADDLAHAIAAGYGVLAKAIVKQAIRDVLGPDDFEKFLAATWLDSEYGRNMAELAGFNVDLIRRWVMAGCPTNIERCNRAQHPDLLDEKDCRK